MLAKRHTSAIQSPVGPILVTQLGRLRLAWFLGTNVGSKCARVVVWGMDTYKLDGDRLVVEHVSACGMRS